MDTCDANGSQCNEYKDTLLAAVKFFPSRLGFDAMVRTDGNDDRKAQNEDEPKCLFVFNVVLLRPIMRFPLPSERYAQLHLRCSGSLGSRFLTFPLIFPSCLKPSWR